MNKKIKSLVMAGLVSIMAGSAVVSSNALCKDNVTTTSKKGAIYIFVNGKKHVINLGGINKPSQDNNQNNNNSTNTSDFSKEQVEVLNLVKLHMKPNQMYNTSKKKSMMKLWLRLWKV